MPRVCFSRFPGLGKPGQAVKRDKIISPKFIALDSRVGANCVCLYHVGVPCAMDQVYL